MKLSTLLSRTFKHYWTEHLVTSAGIALTTAILCGALVIGDSLNRSLLHIVDLRLGKVTQTLTAGDRIFTQALALKLQAAPVLKTEAVASVQGGGFQVGKVQVWGVDSSFARLQKVNIFEDLAPDEAFVSDNLAKKLQLRVGDEFRLLLKKTGPIPGNTPFVTENDQTVSRLVTVKAILDKKQLGTFNLQVSQTQPFNIFVNLLWLNETMGLKGKANVALFGTRSISEQSVRQSCSLEDINLLQNAPGRINSERVFIEDEAAKALKTSQPKATGVLTYFVNQLELNGRATPYSFVSAVENRFEGLQAQESVLNQWLADDLNAKVGDSINVRYFVFGPLRTLVEKQTILKVVKILPMAEAVQDSILMPQLPGLSDAGNCRDWKAGIPIDLKRIRPKDEAYWKQFKGTPKAYVSLAFGQELWRNRYGAYTTFLLPDPTLPNIDIDPFPLQFQLNDVRKDGLVSAKSGVDFGQLFAGLGMFILAGGLLLTILLFSLSLKRRENQLLLYTSLGFSKKLIHNIFLAEIVGLSLFGTVAGLLLTIGYSKLILLALNRLWNDIVRTDVLELHFSAGTLLTGFFISFVLGLTVVYIGISKRIDRINKKAKPIKKINGAFALGSLLVTLLLVVLLLTNLLPNDIYLWLLAGIALLTSCLTGARTYFAKMGRKTGKTLDANSLGWKNLSRNPTRSFTIFALLALGSFVIVVTALNKKQVVDNSLDPSNGTGGFEFVAETTVPILRDLNDPTTRAEYGLPDSTAFVQFHAAYDDHASCLNLNRVANPRILATDPINLEGRFSFANEKGWQALNQDINGLIPAIADQSVIQWGLGKKIGDTLTYVGSQGEQVKLLLVGGLSNSIFQGHVLISDKNFLKHFNSGNGSNFLLVDCPQGRKAAVSEELNTLFRDKGMLLQDSVEKLAEFNAVESTYLSIFFLTGAFGMLLGIVGLSIFLIRNLLERRNELALFKAMGFTNRSIFQILLFENLTLFLGGILSGTLSAILATFPTVMQGAQTVPVGFLLTVLGILLVNGLAWISLVVWRMIRKISPAKAFIND